FGITRFEEVFVKGNQLRLRQLLANLVDNAIRYTSEEDTVTLSVYRHRDRAYLEVSDTGIGIDAAHLPHVLDRFYRADKARSRLSGGTGLGLAIVKRIAEQHGGSVTVTSQPGSGTRVTVSLPL
ncbi:MAG: ATP-binding protein, partial [Dehalococcoidales bacterium]